MFPWLAVETDGGAPLVEQFGSDVPVVEHLLTCFPFHVVVELDAIRGCVWVEAKMRDVASGLADECHETAIERFS